MERKSSFENILVTGRISFPNLLLPYLSKTAKPTDIPKYGCHIITDLNSPEQQKFMACVGRISLDMWKEHSSQIMTMIQNDKRMRAYGYGNEKVNKTTLQVYNGYQDKFFIASSSVDQPQAIDKAGNPINPVNTMAIQAEFKKIYSGCHVCAALNVWTQDNSYGRAIRCKIIAIQFLKDDTPFTESVVDVKNLGFGSVPAATGDEAPPFPGMPSFLS